MMKTLTGWAQQPLELHEKRKVESENVITSASGYKKKRKKMFAFFFAQLSHLQLN